MCGSALPRNSTLKECGKLVRGMHVPLNVKRLCEDKDSYPLVKTSNVLVTGRLSLDAHGPHARPLCTVGFGLHW